MSAPRSPYLERQELARGLADLAHEESWPYPWVYMPPDGQPFSARGSAVAPAFGVGNQVAVATYSVLDAYDAVLLAVMQLYIGTGFVQGSGDIVWDIDVNRPVASTLATGYHVPDFAATLTSLGDLTKPWPVLGGWRLTGGEIVRAKVRTVGTVGTGAPNRCHAALIGWTWPSRNL